MSDKDKVRVYKKKITQSSRKWLERQLNDPYVKLAQKEGKRSRAAFKLEEMIGKFKLLMHAKVVVDLGAAPGGWTQAIKLLKPNAKIIALDIQDFEPIPGTFQIIGDVSEEGVIEHLHRELDGALVDLVLSDMAASSCGIQSVDHDRIMNLLEIAIDFAFEHLNKGGHFVAKVLRGGTEAKLLQQLKLHFTKVQHFKPSASRQDSAEMYVVATGFKG